MSISARFMCELDSDIQKLASDHRCTKRHILSIIESFKSVTKIDESDLPTLHICFCKLWKILLEYSKHNEDSVELIRKTNDVILNVTDRFSIYNSLVTNSINLLKLIIEYSLIGCDSVKELLPVFNIWLSRCSNDCISQFAEQHKGTISKLYDLVENGDVHQQFLVLEAVWRIYHKSKHFHLERIIPPNLFEVLRGATENHLHRDLRRFITLKNEDLSDSVFSMKCEGITYNFYELQGVPDGGFKENDIWVDFHLFLGKITIICDRNSLIQSHYPIPLCEFEALTFYSKDIQTFQYQRKRFTNCHKFVFKIGLLENKTNLFPGDKPSPELLSLKIVAKMSGEQDSNLQSNIIPKMFGRFLKTKKVGQSIDHFLKEPDENVPSTSILKKTSRFMDDVSFSNREDQLPQPSVASMEKRSVTAVVDSLKSTGLISKSISPISFATNMLQDVMDEDEDQASSSESSEVLATTIEGLFRKNSEKIGPVQATIDLTKDSLEYAMNNTTNSEMSQMDKVERWLRNSESQKKVLNEIVPNNKRIQTFVILSDEEECSDEEEYEEPLQKTSLAKRSLLQKSREEISNSKESPNLPINSKRSSSITVVNKQCSKIKKSTGISTNKRNLSIINESIMRETAELSANDRYSSPTSANEQNAGDESRIADDEDRSPCPVIINDNDKEKPVMQESAEFRKNATDDEDGSVINKNFEPPMQEPIMQESIGNTKSDQIVPSSVSPVVIDEEPIIQEVTGSVINKNSEPPIQEPIMQESTGNTKSDKFVPPSVSPVVIDEEPIIQEVTGSVINKNFEPPMQEPIMQESTGNTKSDKFVPPSVSPVVIDKEPIIQEVTGLPQNDKYISPVLTDEEEPIIQKSTEIPTSLAIGKIDVADQYESDDDLPLSLWIEKRNKRCSKQNVKSETTSKPKRKGPQLKLKMPQKVPKNKRKDAVEVNKPNKFMGTITDMMEEHDRHLSMKRAEVDAGKTGNDNEDVSVRMRKRKLYDPKDISYLSEMDCAGYAEPQVPATEIITIKDTPKRRKKSQSPRRNNGGVSESDWEYFRSVIRERKMNKKDKVQNTGFDETCVDKHVAKENGFIFKDLTELRNSPIENKRRKMPKYHEGTSGELEDHSKGTSGSNKVKILENNLIRGPNTCINNNEDECSCHEKLRLIKQIIGSGCCCEFN